MKTGGSLFWTSLIIALRESGKRLLWMLLPVGLCGLVLAGLFASRTTPVFSVRVALVNQDTSALGASLPASLLQNAVEGVTVDTVDAAQADLERYAAVIWVPAGYVDGILSGENLPLEVVLNRATPLEALWLRQMVEQGLSALGQGQLAVQSALQMGGDDMNDIALGLLVLDLNTSLLRAFSGGDGMLTRETLRLTGSFTLAQYAIVSLFTGSFMALGFVFAPTVSGLAGFPRRKIVVETAAAFHVVLIAALFCLLLTLLLYGAGNLSVMRALFAGALLGLYVWAVCRFCGKPGVSGAAGMGLAFLQAVLCGGILPLSLLPPILGKIAPLLPYYWIMRLLRPL